MGVSPPLSRHWQNPLQTQHCSSQEAAASWSSPARSSHFWTQSLHELNGAFVTSEQVPSFPAVHCAYCRHLSPGWYIMVQAWGGVVPQARSRPWQLVNPQDCTGAGRDVDGGTGVGTAVGGVVLPAGAEVQPAASRAATVGTPHMQRTESGVVHGDHIWCEKSILRGRIYGFI